MIYSPCVPVFRDDAGNLLETPYLASFISSPAPNAGAIRIAPQLRPGHNRHHADVVVRTRVDAVEAKRAVHVARFPRLVETQLATGNFVTAADAVLGRARNADRQVAHLDLQR